MRIGLMVMSLCWAALAEAGYLKIVPGLGWFGTFNDNLYQSDNAQAQEDLQLGLTPGLKASYRRPFVEVEDLVRLSLSRYLFDELAEQPSELSLNASFGGTLAVGLVNALTFSTTVVPKLELSLRDDLVYQPNRVMLDPSGLEANQGIVIGAPLDVPIIDMLDNTLLATANRVFGHSGRMTLDTSYAFRHFEAETPPSGESLEARGFQDTHRLSCQPAAEVADPRRKLFYGLSGEIATVQGYTISTMLLSTSGRITFRPGRSMIEFETGLERISDSVKDSTDYGLRFNLRGEIPLERDRGRFRYGLVREMTFLPVFNAYFQRNAVWAEGEVLAHRFTSRNILWVAGGVLLSRVEGDPLYKVSTGQPSLELRLVVFPELEAVLGARYVRQWNHADEVSALSVRSFSNLIVTSSLNYQFGSLGFPL